MRSRLPPTDGRMSKCFFMRRPDTRSPIRFGRPMTRPRPSSPASGSGRCCNLFEGAQKPVDVSGRGLDRLRVLGRKCPVEEAVSGARVKLNLDIAVSGSGSGDRVDLGFWNVLVGQAVVKLERNGHLANLVEVLGDAERVKPDGGIDA